VISVIIPNYNGKKYLSKCISSIPKDIQIILVDNNSGDKSQNIRREGLKLIQNKANLGFAKAVNIGLPNVKTNFVLILNSDTILDKNWFLELKKNISEHPGYFCYCGTIYKQDGDIENTGFVFKMSGKAELRKSTMEGKIWGSPATACVYETKKLKQLSGFDESYFAYIEDVDLHYRANKLGFETYYSKDLKCQHYGGGSAGKDSLFRAKNTFKNWFVFIKNNYSSKEIFNNLAGIIIERLKNFKYLMYCFINDNRH